MVCKQKPLIKPNEKSVHLHILLVLLDEFQNINSSRLHANRMENLISKSSVGANAVLEHMSLRLRCSNMSASKVEIHRHMNYSIYYMHSSGMAKPVGTGNLGARFSAS